MTRSLSETLGGGSPDQWALDFLARAHFEATPANVQTVVSWEYAESSGGGGMWNPLNTTQGGYPGETNFNSVGVKNYVRRSDGIDANAHVIHNGYYPGVINRFLNGNDARATCDAITASPWGTGHIQLIGAPQGPVSPQGVEMALVASPHKPTTVGRVPAALWGPESPNVVKLTNGASIAHDVPVGGGKRQWSPPLQVGRHGVGIMATIGRDGRPDGRGIVFQDDAGQTYIGLWS